MEQSKKSRGFGDIVEKITGKPANHFYYDQFKNSAKLLNK